MLGISGGRVRCDFSRSSRARGRRKSRSRCREMLRFPALVLYRGNAVTAREPGPGRHPYPNPSPAASVSPPTATPRGWLGWLWSSRRLAGHVLPRRAAGGPARGEGAPARTLARPSSGSGDALRGAGGGRGRSLVRPAAAGAAAVLPSRRVHGGRGWRPLQVASLT